MNATDGNIVKARDHSCRVHHGKVFGVGTLIGPTFTTVHLPQYSCPGQCHKCHEGGDVTNHKDVSRHYEGAVMLLHNEGWGQTAV